MVRFKPDDVIQYGEGQWEPPSDGIVDRHDDTGLYVKAFRHFTGSWDGQWRDNDSSSFAVGDDRRPRAHPDAERVWAEYCAWRLTHGS